MKKRRIAVLFAILSLPAWLSISCRTFNGPFAPDGDKDTAWWECKGFDLSDEKHFKVLFPNGGELFRVGDTVRIQVCSEDEDHSVDQASKEVSVDGGAVWVPIFAEMDGPEIVWVIPPRLEDVMNQTTVSTISSNCLFRVVVYSAQGDISVDRDTSDSPFAIEMPQ